MWRTARAPPPESGCRELPGVRAAPEEPGLVCLDARDWVLFRDFNLRSYQLLRDIYQNEEVSE